MGEIVLIAVVALLVLGPDRLPSAAKAIGKGIRDLRSQTKDLQQTIEKDTQLGDAVREIRGALRGDPETLYKRATGEKFNAVPEKIGTPPPGAERSASEPGESEELESALPSDASQTEADESAEPGPGDAYANTDDAWGQPPQNPHPQNPHDEEELAAALANDPDVPVIRTPAGSLARGSEADDDSSHG